MNILETDLSEANDWKTFKFCRGYFDLHIIPLDLGVMQDINSIQTLLDYFDRLLPLNEEEKALIRAKFRPHLFLKRQFALQHGDVCQYFDFVVRGCLRLYKADSDGVYHILQLRRITGFLILPVSIRRRRRCWILMPWKIRLFFASLMMR